MPPTIHVTQYSTSALETNKTESRSYVIIPYKIVQGVRVLETLYFPENKKNLDTAQHSHVQQEDAQAKPDAGPGGGPVVLRRNPTRSCLTATTLIYATGAGNYRGCWHQTCLPIDTRKGI